MNGHLGLLSTLGLTGATALVAWSLLSRPVDPRMIDEPIDPFTAAYGPQEPLRDSMRAMGPASPMPIPLAGYAMSPKPLVREQAPAQTPAVPAGVQLRARRTPLLNRLLEQPTAFLMRHTSLSSAAEFRHFLSNKSKVDAYLNSPLVRAALKNPAVAKSVIGNGALVRAFLATPAMKNQAAVRQLVQSRMFLKMLDCPGVQGALSDVAVMARLIGDPQTLTFIEENPEAAQALGKAFPALAQSLSN